MKRIYKNIIPFLLLPIMVFVLFTGRAEAASNYSFAPSSVLSSGKWVKVRIDESGIYELSYSDLREMGFENPASVCVFGKGGISLPLSFTSDNKPMISDDLSQIGVYHYNDKIYFYAQGVDDIEFLSSYFERKSKNIYSNYGAYFLTDSVTPESIVVAERPKTTASACISGYDYIFHENDLFQNTTLTGQLFWGEDLLGSPKGYEWKLSLPFIDIFEKARLQVKAYAADKSSGTFHYGIAEASAGNQSYKVKHPSPASGSKINPEFIHMTNPVSTLSLDSKDLTLYAKVENAAGSFINLDYWLLSYTKRVPDFLQTSTAQERLTVKVKGSKPGKITIPSAGNIVAFDVTDRTKAVMLPAEKNNDQTVFYYPYFTGHKDLIFCDLSREQKHISGYENIENSDLHAKANEGADFIIISTPKFKEMAERFAELHRTTQNISVITATTTEIYNEFSGGIPDPMAYRAFTKLCYESSDKKLKNLLLMGPVTGDIRKMEQTGNVENYIIGFQDNKVNADTEAANVMDFYGFTDDAIYASLQNNTMQVGVGMLPFETLPEAEIYFTKAENYLNDKDKAAIVNEFLSIGGVGDNHTHALQSIQIADYWAQYEPQKQLNTIIALDAYKETESRRKISSDWQYGKLFSQYFGHGSSFGLNSNRNIFNVPDIELLNNKRQGFMFICACDISKTDQGKKGFGELLTIGNANGMVGTIFSTRTVWSGQNYELAKQFASSLFAAPDKMTDPNDASIVRTVYRLKSPTIGEVFARAKTLSNYSNSLNYIFVGDPALTIPVPLRRISANPLSKASSGQRIRISGTVSVADSIHLRDTLPIESFTLPKDKRYNGKIVVKLMAPERTLRSADYLTNNNLTGKELYVTYNDVRLAEYYGTVKEGVFDFDITLPESLSTYNDGEMQLFLSAYDSDRDLAASGYLSFKSEGENGNPSVADITAPSIEVEYKPDMRMLVISSRDEGGIARSSLGAMIDEAQCEPIMTYSTDDSNEVEYSIFTDRLAAGSHTLQLNISDIAGNYAQKEFSFVSVDKLHSLNLSADRTAILDEIEFSVNEALTGAVLIIADHDGNIVTEIEMTGNTLLWDCKDNEGSPLKAGLYKAVVTEKDAASNKFSQWINFAVLK
ncbi:MAG: hypothetical protein K2L89_08820 [Muribaculaceae bacterium]|nr:hypothetical protein [Muribaculaceae bacterium]